MWFTEDDVRLADFRSLVEQATDPAGYPQADRIEQGIPIYAARFRERAGRWTDAGTSRPS